MTSALALCIDVPRTGLHRRCGQWCVSWQHRSSATPSDLLWPDAQQPMYQAAFSDSVAGMKVGTFHEAVPDFRLALMEYEKDMTI
ncbi:hypothetical protein D3C80_1710320 [compost metagenome]